jgi:hypothetical protein
VKIANPHGRAQLHRAPGAERRQLSSAPNLEGDARLVVETGADDFRGSTDTAAVTVKVILAPRRA